MHIVTSHVLVDRYGESVVDLLKQLSPDVTVLPSNDFVTVKAHCDTVSDEILIVGGPSVIPFGVVANPVQDPDSSVLTDNPYGCTTDPTFLIPNKIVTRLPDEDLQFGEDFLPTVINHQLGYLKTKSTKTGWLSYAAQAWASIAMWMESMFAMGDNNLCPPTTSATITTQELQEKKLAYINLHGTQSAGSYYGQSGTQYPEALHVVNGMFNGCMVVTEACYGGYISNRNKETSIPLMALYSGAVAVLASTSVAYGPAQAPPDSADLLSYTFYKRILAGQPFGQAVLGAKQDFAAQCIQAHGSIQPSNKKTLLQFVPYGLPIMTL